MVCLDVPKSCVPSQFINIYLPSLTQYMSSLNLPIKESETIVSSEVFIYGRQVYFNGAEMESSIKRILRAFPDGNEALMNVANDLSSCSSATEACVKASCNPLPLSLSMYYYQ